MNRLGVTATVTGKWMITIPKEVRESLGIKRGMKVKFVRVGEGFLIVPVKPLRDSFGDGGEAMNRVACEIAEERRREREHDDAEL
ncbi:MAG: AbrB/MazE/SpoVT family DNA-binding domain-containing protein [Candidatus Jordarchaeales archaeon]